MQRLLSLADSPEEWEKCKAFYHRLTLSVMTGVNRPQFHYPSPRTEQGSLGYSTTRLFRTEIFDVGYHRTYFELCKLISNSLLW